MEILQHKRLLGTLQDTCLLKVVSTDTTIVNVVALKTSVRSFAAHIILEMLIEIMWHICLLYRSRKYFVQRKRL